MISTEQGLHLTLVLSKVNSKLVHPSQNLASRVWLEFEGRLPSYSSDAVYIQPIGYAGKRW